MANRIIGDLFGTSLSRFLVGAITSTAVAIKNVGGVLRVRNKADSADADFVAAKLSASGDAIEFNEDAAGSGADWKLTLQRASSGMTSALTFTLPAADGSTGQALITDGSGNLSFTTVAGGNDKPVIDTTTIAFGASSPVSMFTKPSNAVSIRIIVVVDTAFNGTAPTVSIGISGTTSKFMPATAIDLKTVGIYEWNAADVATVGSTEAVIATYNADSSSAGSARVMFEYVNPS